jgi:hypothetical protein
MSKHIHSKLFASLIITLIFATGYYYNSSVHANDKFSIVMAVSSEIDLQDFRSSLSNIVNQSQSLTKSYQDEVGKWMSHQYDNSTFISITDSYIPKFENLVNSAQNLTYPTDYKYVYDALVNSLQSETDSNKHFRNFLQSGNKTENQISIDLLSKAWQYEMTYSKFLSTPLPNSSQTVT